MRGPGLVILVVFVSAVTSVVTVLGMNHLQLPRRETAKTVEVPSVKGLSEADARQNLKALGLVFLVGERKPAPGAQPGTVVEQSPTAGKRVAENAPVSVALARELPKVPNLVGRTLVEAAALATPLGFKLEPGEGAVDAKTPKDHVVSQEPPAQTEQSPETPVVVHLSLGPGDIEVPRLLGQHVEPVKALAKEKGFELKVLWTEEGETPNYVVLNQNPPPGSKIKPGDTVTVTVNH